MVYYTCALVSLLVTIVAFIYVDAFIFMSGQASKPAYCPEDKQIKSLLRRKLTKQRRSRRGVSWPYDCFHASILKYQGQYQFISPIHTCCKSCDFPDFANCVSEYPTPSWRCPSDGFHCVFKCVKKHDPNGHVRRRGRTGTTIRRVRQKLFRRRVVRLRVRPTTISNKCEKRVIRSGQLCIERLCIPLKL